MLRVKTTIRLEIKGPLLTKSSAPGEYGLDAIVARTIDGIPYIAGSHLAGKIRQALEEIETCDIPCPWFKEEVKNKITGKASANYQPSAKEVFISDFLLDEGDQKKDQRIRIQVDPIRGAVKKGAQLFIESPFASGQAIKFKGRVIFFVKDETIMDNYLEHIEAALKWTTQLGGYRSIGFGRLEDVKISIPRKNKYQASGNWPGPDRTIDILVTPKFPFCIAGKQVDGNLFETEDVISGGTMLGSIATSWHSLAGSSNFSAIDKLDDSNRTQLKAVFNDLKINHAFPTSDSRIRPVVPPLSLVKVDSDNGKPYYDVARCDKPCLIHNLTPEFSVDWKNSADVELDFGWPEIRKEMRVRTAIDPDYLRAKDSELFAYEMTVPDALTWVSRITLPQKDADKSGKQLASLLEHGITGLGKTKTVSSVQMLPAGSVKSCHASSLKQRDGIWIITLQTPALLCDPALLQESGDSRRLQEAYHAVFMDISSDSLSLDRFFASQKLAGGTYLYSRFQRGKDSNGKEKPYYPWLLSNEGSVFVLSPVTGREQVAKDCIEDWYKNGIPMPKWAQKTYAVQKNGRQVDGSHWSACPYIRQNGYGEIAVNLDIHWKHYPKDNIRQDIGWSAEEDNNDE